MALNTIGPQSHHSSGSGVFPALVFVQGSEQKNIVLNRSPFTNRETFCESSVDFHKIWPASDIAAEHGSNPERRKQPGRRHQAVQRRPNFS